MQKSFVCTFLFYT